MKLLFVIGISASVFTLNSCASTYDDGDQEPSGIAAFADDARLGEQVDKICFSNSIDGFSNATKDTVVLDRGVSDEYIVEVMSGCQNLKWAQAIQLDSNLSCLSKFDNLVVYDSAFGGSNTPGSPERCAIRKIHKWNKDAVDEEAEDDGMKTEEEIANSPIK